MDPYQILGISRACTLDEVKKAFRARAWLAHPDRGGENESFIRLCNAYEEILKERYRNPRPGVHATPRAVRKGPVVESPDPNWSPGFVLRNEAPGGVRHPRAPDPRWIPDLFISEDTPSVSRPRNPSDLGLARRTYVSWLRHVSAQAGRSRSVWKSDWMGRMGMTVIFGVMVGGLWGCWLAWSYDPAEAAREAAFEANAAEHARVKAAVEAEDGQSAGSAAVGKPSKNRRGDGR